MNFQTELKFKPQSENCIDYASSILLLGSCFTENIGSKLDYFKFKSSVNPFGILFHPKAIETLISNAINEYSYSQTDVFFHNEHWHCFDAHSKLSNTSKSALLEHLNSNLLFTKRQVKQASHIVITLGTAWIYRFLETNAIVANCHKRPQKQFEKTLLSVDAIFTALQNCITLIHKENPTATVIFTVSPIRHIKDGFIENTQSKAHLITAIHQLIEKYASVNKSQLHYFPAYEIMMDTLRDYRFYKSDMLHPNALAIDYIWEKFKNVWLSNSVLDIMNTVDGIQKRKAHKPFNSNSEAHKKMRLQIEADIALLQKKHPHIKF